jgi:hypothetical protein
MSFDFAILDRPGMRPARDGISFGTSTSARVERNIVRELVD